jgi:PKD-like domain
VYTWIYNNDTIKTQKGPVANILMTALGGKVCVYVTNFCKLSSSVACQDIRANLKPAKPVITGDDLVCNGKSGNYCVSNYSNLYIYDWTVPLGATLNTNNSKCVTINFGTLIGFQDVCVKATNECGSVDTCFQVELKNVPPATTEIFGNKATCFNDTTSYWITPLSTASGYEWTIVGGTIVSGTTKDSVKVVWKSVGNGSICLKSSNICGSSPDYCQNIVVSEKYYG